ncbi:uncharacterized protein LAESUDRAFT_610962, partial [Laetiporus sulphureus 93-53]
ISGTVAPHRGYILLHTHRPPPEYPAKFKSPLFRELTRRTMKWGALVNFSWSPDQAVHPDYSGMGEHFTDGLEMYRATAFSILGHRLDVPEVSMANIDAVEQNLRLHVEAVESKYALISRDTQLHLYVCTHAQRDCRCGDTGGEVAHALRQEVQKREMSAKQVLVGEVGHVGQHKFAANLLVFPYGDWLGTLQEFDVSTVLDEILEKHQSHTTVSLNAPPIGGIHWRGRMGLDKEMQKAMM